MSRRFQDVSTDQMDALLALGQDVVVQLYHRKRGDQQLTGRISGCYIDNNTQLPGIFFQKKRKLGGYASGSDKIPFASKTQIIVRLSAGSHDLYTAGQGAQMYEQEQFRSRNVPIETQREALTYGRLS